MGKLPILRGRDMITKSKLLKFGGINHRSGARDGELYDMRNMCSNDYPLLSTRPPRRLCRALTKANGLYGWNGLCWVDGTKFYFNGTEKGTVTDTKKSFAGIGAYIVIMPDKKYYDTETDSFGSLESEWSGSSLTFTNGTLYGEEAKRNAIRATDVTWDEWFRVGDAVSISGCTQHSENNKSAIIREIAGDTLHFYENVFVLDGEEQETEYTESGSLKLTRSVPELAYLCENENRLWGCSGNTIYASKLGDIFNWNVFDGLGTDSYAVDTGSAGDFTGAVSYLGYPTFFKENNIYKVYGSLPSNFELTSSATLGMPAGAGASTAIAGETLIFLSRTGFAAYTGGIPQPIHKSLGNEPLFDAIGGSNGRKYYVSCRTKGEQWRLLVYDTENNVWHVEDEKQVTAFAYYGGDLYFTDADGKLWMTEDSPRAPAGSTMEDAVHWRAEFSDFTENEPNRKGAGKVQIRLELEQGAMAQVWIQYDSDGIYERVGELMTATAKRSFLLPVIPRRCDHYRIRITGIGQVKIYSIAREFTTGSGF